MAVQKATLSNRKAVVGVVVQALRVEVEEGERGPSLDIRLGEGEIPPEGYLTIVTHGLARAKTDASRAGLEVGDWLTVSTVPGAVRKAAHRPVKRVHERDTASESFSLGARP